MACYLRVFGDELDVKTLLETLDISASKIWKKGTPRFKNNPTKLNSVSGFNIQVSDAEWSEFNKQKEEAVEFLGEHKALLSSISSYIGVDGCYLDFGIEWRNDAVQSDSFSPELIKLAGEIGFGIELSQYPPEEDEE